MRLLMLSESRTVHAQRWSKALVRRGWDVGLVSVSDTPIPGVEIVPLKTPPFGLSYPRRWWGRYAQYLRDVIDRFGADVVHIHYLTDYPVDGFPGHGRRLAVRNGGRYVPLVISTWGADIVQDEWVPHDNYAQRGRKVDLLQAADAVTATTRYLADCTAEYARINRADISVIPFGVDLQRYEAPGHKSCNAALTVGFIKHLEPKYGLDVLVRAIPRVVARHPAVRFVIVGQGSLEKDLRRLSVDLGVADCIEWRGAIAHSEVPATLSTMDVFAMPSVSCSETFGVSAIEAQAAGVPVVFGDLPGVREAVTDGAGGLAVPPADVGALSDALCRLLGDENLRRRLGRQGREAVHERFDFEANVDAMLEVYGRVMTERLCPAV